MMLLTEATTVGGFDLSSIDFSSLLTTYGAVLGIAIPAVIAMIGLKKGVKWALGFFKKA